MFKTAPNIETTHAFTTRSGGVSEGIYSSLNLGRNLGDDPGRVKANYGILCSALGVTESSIIRVNQVHGARIHVAAPPGNIWPPSAPAVDADGLVTSDPGMTLMIFTADCVPILLHDPVARAVGAVHAGWRGTAADAAGSAVRAMAREFGSSPSDVRAAIGPCISKCCYETDSDVADAMSAALGASAAKCVFPRAGKFMVDLKEANRLLLARAGVEDIHISGDCTSCLSDIYWSHRRTKGIRGSQAALITLGKQYENQT